MHEQIEREVQMDKFFRRGKYTSNVNPATGEIIEPVNMIHPDRPNRCQILKRYCPSMTMNTDMAIITQRLFVSHKDKKFFHTVEIATCKREDAPHVYEKYAQAWRLEEESK